LKIKWFRSGRDDSDRIADLISIDNPVAAEAIVAKIENAIAKLEAYPFVGRKGRIVGTRELVVP
jgi:toxin ParE1/3/4